MDEWQKGFRDALEYCKVNYKPFQPLKLPDRFVYRGDSWSRGFGEGLITGQNQIIDEAYPGNIGFSVESATQVKIFYPKGHKELNDNQ